MTKAGERLIAAAKSATASLPMGSAVAMLLALAKHNIPTDIQELLIYGNSMMDVAPGALSAALKAALAAGATLDEGGGEG